MVNLVTVVEKVRDDLKREYLRDTSNVWEHPFVVIIKRNGVGVIEGAQSPDALAGWLRNQISVGELKGVVVGRMMAKYSKLAGPDGNPTMQSKAIVVNGRMLDDGWTHISITPIKEHKDFRKEGSDKKVDGVEVYGVSSPDKVEDIIDPATGEKVGVLEAAFRKEEVLDSRQGEKCSVDPIIANVTDDAMEEKYED